MIHLTPFLLHFTVIAITIKISQAKDTQYRIRHQNRSIIVLRLHLLKLIKRYAFCFKTQYLFHGKQNCHITNERALCLKFLSNLYNNEILYTSSAPLFSQKKYNIILRRTFYTLPNNFYLYMKCYSIYLFLMLLTLLYWCVKTNLQRVWQLQHCSRYNRAGILTLINHPPQGHCWSSHQLHTPAWLSA